MGPHRAAAARGKEANIGGPVRLLIGDTPKMSLSLAVTVAQVPGSRIVAGVSGYSSLRIESSLS